MVYIGASAVQELGAVLHGDSQYLQMSGEITHIIVTSKGSLDWLNDFQRKKQSKRQYLGMIPGILCLYIHIMYKLPVIKATFFTLHTIIPLSFCVG